MPAGFTDDLRQQARDLQARLQAGENIPREELVAFLTKGETEMKKGIALESAPPKAIKPPAPKDVDFF